jgi:cytochrome b561/polyisoprenoid-binding protein YceI
VTAGARYTAVAIVLHWAIAAAILANFGLGWWMHRAIEVAERQAAAISAFQVHKSLGLTVLLLSVLRLAWRLTHRAPPLPPSMPAWQHRAARAVQGALYALMVLVPLSGWTYVSAQWRCDAPLTVPTLWFGLFEVPHLFDAGSVDAAGRKAIAARNFTAHLWLAWATLALFVVHAAAAVRHQFLHRDEVFASMVPRRGAGVAIGAVVLALAGLVTLSLVRGGADRAPRVTSAPGGWVVDPASEIAFAGTHAGAPFRGRFARWQADLRFNPLAPAPVVVTATIETASATDGDTLHDETLPLPEWFDVGRYPHARFVATRISPRPQGGHTVEGALTIKDRVIAVPPLELVVDGDVMRIHGRFHIDRAEANLGQESDPFGEYVSRRIAVEVNVRAARP